MAALLAQLAVAGATVLALMSLVPQIVKLVRSRDPSGVSPSWPAIGLVSNAAWTAYLIAVGLWPASISTASMIVLYVVVLWALARVAVPLRPAAGRGLAWALVLAAIGVGAGWLALGAVLGVSHIVQMSPAIHAAYTTRYPRGISTATWWISGVEGALWGYYGWFHGDIPVMIFAATFGTSAALILARYYWAVGRFTGDQPPEKTRSAA